MTEILDRPVTAPSLVVPRWPGWVAAVVLHLCRATAAVLLLLVFWSLVPTTFGWTSTVVMSGSMQPRLHPGDVAVVRPAFAAQAHIGQVLLVDDPDIRGRLRLHRYVGVQDGKLILRGDANGENDSTRVLPSAVHGIAVLRIPDIGLPALWWRDHRWPPLAATAFLLLLLIAGTQPVRRRRAEPAADLVRQAPRSRSRGRHRA